MPKRKTNARRYFVASPPPVGVVACPSIHEDESIQSLLWRLSRANGITILSAARALGLTYPGGDISATYLIHPHDSSPVELGKYLQSAFLHHYADKGLRIIPNETMRTLAHRELIRGGNSLICPHCLAEPPGYWRLSWKMAFVFACPKHQCLLSAECPGCSQGHGTGKKDRSVLPPHTRAIGSTVTCMNTATKRSRNARTKRPCGADLRNIEVPAVVDVSLISAQQLLLKLYQEGDGVETNVAEWSFIEFFDDLWVLCAAVIFAGPPSLAAGLGSEIEAAWKAHCKTRSEDLIERKGRKGSKDHPFAKIPAPAILAVAVRTALPILLAESDAEMQHGLKELQGHIAKRAPKAVQRLRNQEPMSHPLRLALVETSIAENQVLAYLRNHPAKGRRMDFHHYDKTITPEFIASELPEVITDVDAAEFVIPFQVMVRFVICRTAQYWGEVCRRTDPPTTPSKILRLVNEASKANVSRKLARLVVAVATSDAEYGIVTYNTLNLDGKDIVWYERASDYYAKRENI